MASSTRKVELVQCLTIDGDFLASNQRINWSEKTLLPIPANMDLGFLPEWTWTKHKFINIFSLEHHSTDNDKYKRKMAVGVLLISTCRESQYYFLSWMTSCIVTSLMHLVWWRAKLIWIALCVLAAALLYWHGGFCRSLWTSWVFQIAVMIRLTLLIVHS